MFLQKKSRLHYAVGAVLIFLLYILQYCGFLPIHGASPILVLPALIISSMFLGEWCGAVMGLITGIFVDAVSGDALCFNSVSLLLIGCAAGLIIHLLLNNNLFSSIILNLVFTFLYVNARWIAFYLVRGFDNAKYHYINYSLPSFFITVILSVPLYFIIRKMMKTADTRLDS